MNSRLRIHLHPADEERARLQRLQLAFASACNEVAEVAQQTRCWNRVALHHKVYRDLRTRHPALGSQMACNVVYAVSRACRAVYQGRGSPYSLQALGDAPLPRVQFEPDAPVYFDRHTLSLRGRLASLFTLDGRMRFEMALAADDAARLRDERLVEILLHRRQGEYVLDFFFAAARAPGISPAAEPLPTFLRIDRRSTSAHASTLGTAAPPDAEEAPTGAPGMPQPHRLP